MARLDLTDDERELLVQTLRGVIAGDRFPLSPRRIHGEIAER
jgi:hypothetical protein